MDGVSADMCRGDAGGGGNRRLHAAGTQIGDVLVYRVRLAASGLAGEKDVRTRFQYRQRFSLGHGKPLYQLSSWLSTNAERWSSGTIVGFQYPTRLFVLGELFLYVKT